MAQRDLAVRQMPADRGAAVSVASAFRFGGMAVPDRSGRAGRGMAVARYLADTSALVRLHRPAAGRPGLHRLGAG